MWSVSTNRHSADHPFRFTDLLKLQNEVLTQLMPTQGSALLLAEVAPVLTLGARQILSNEQTLRFAKFKTEVTPGERGGNETWHGPGQWVCFVLTPLQAFTGDSKGVRKAVYRILSKVLKVSQDYKPEAELREGCELGIWSTLGKLASVGIKIKEGYVTSGFALNCIRSEESFLGIQPCGLVGAKPDFLLSEQSNSDQKEEEFKKIKTKIIAAFSED